MSSNLLKIVFKICYKNNNELFQLFKKQRVIIRSSMGQPIIDPNNSYYVTYMFQNNLSDNKHIYKQVSFTLVESEDSNLTAY